jgi:hypothetical protein
VKTLALGSGPTIADRRDPEVGPKTARSVSKKSGAVHGGITLDIRYVTRRSQFLGPCEAAIRRHRAELDAGGIVSVNLPPGGYDGRVIVTIRPNDCSDFGTDWEHPDPTRFPARIKAAATALRNCGCEGRYEVSHSDGSLTIRAVSR